MMSQQGDLAARELRAVLDLIEPVMPEPFPPRVNGIIAAVEASELDASIKSRAVTALLIGEGYHLIQSGNLIDPHFYPTLSAMRDDLTRQINTLRRT